MLRLVVHSKAGYSTWIHLPSLRMLLDAGEGFNDHIEGQMLSVREVLISHAHADHFAGMVSMMAGRFVDMFGRGHERAPLRILYPRGAVVLERFFDFLGRGSTLFDAMVELVPMEPEQSIACLARPDLSIHAVRTEHIPGELCLGWRITQRRERLRPELLGAPPELLRQMSRENGRASLHVPIEVPLLLYSGDGRPLLDPAAEKVEVLLHEATFVGEDASRAHSTLAEAVGVHRELHARRTVLLHFSTRYEPEVVEHQMASLGISSHDVLFAHDTSAVQNGLDLNVVLPRRTVTLDLDVSGL